MKKFLPLLSLLVFACSTAISQVGIGNTAPAAVLDVYGANYDYVLDVIGGVAANDGVLVPRVDDLATPGLNEGQLVYLVDAAAPTTNGFYYWDGSAWTTFKSSNASGTATASIVVPDVVIPGAPTASMAFTNSTSTAIPDSGAGCLALNIPVSGVTGATTSVTISLNITHTWDADLDILLQAPTGQILELTTDNGGSADNYATTLFSDAGATNVTTGTAPFNGTYQPEGTIGTTGAPLNLTADISNLAGFNGLAPNGNWILHIGDDLGSDTGTFNTASLNVAGPAVADWVLVGEVSMTALTSHALIVQSTYSGDTSDINGVITALTRSTASAGASGTMIAALPGTIESYASDAPGNNGDVWVNTVNQTRNTGLTNNTPYFYQLWRKGNIETPTASNETFSIIPMRLKE